MKFINKLKTVLVAGGMAAAMFACTDLEELNVDPNNPSEVPASYLLTSGQKYAMENVWDEWANGRFGLVYSQYWSQQAYPSESRFRYRDSSVNSQWISYFAAGGLKDLKASMDIAMGLLENDAIVGDAKDRASNQYAVAQITRVWLMHLVTDIWGPVPYTEALQGNDVIAPSYDKQEMIYSSLLTELTEAQSKVVATTGVDGDVIYNGNMAKWAKFAQSLKLRIALRMADRDNGVKLAEVVAAGGFIAGNEDNATLVFGSAPHNNPLNEDRKTRADFAASNTMVDLLSDMSDPRMGLYFDPTEASVIAGTPEYIGVIYGLDDNTANNLDISEYSQPSAATLYEKAPGIYISYPEVCFALAEAAQRASNATLAATHYEAGIRASMEFWNGQAGLAGMTRTIAQADIDAYVIAHPYDATNWKTSLGIQKWIALYMQGHQGWIEWRRLDFGVLRSPVAGHDRGNGEIPVRRPYPTDEQTLNLSSYSAGVEVLNTEAGFTGSGEFQGDNLNNPVWWDMTKGTQVAVDSDGNPIP
ncbi:SusD/RagB family nutrient-binding outer membrane lipoprotein [Flammeovirga pectinis]|uniref:SusD/RagB family nutrient-binding outer membrane lipoprotein n=1 Tax=Flammeovirga pectinis TaxID=2494373 RepID=A0A3S9P801_9BACT|nr:SusD/RagB family nutrient-binding outer membrane lipoprotein [Flammeovirga pectinis]AZQ64348.1 SusD/RagB family nutrient-binding outer membrane lipoprotein [Flammeovirga pectinis]